MYYPGLFEASANPYSGLSGRQYNGEPLTSVEAHVVDKKNMVSNLSASSLASSSLSLSSSFRATPFPATHYRSPGSTADLLPSPYCSSSVTHLSPSENLLHEQSFLEASTQYGIGPLSSYSHYPQYLSNSVINSALKGANGSSYSCHNSLYPSGASPYLYADSFISDYITRNHLDGSKSSYSANSDNSSFLEHLKRLQESFQSKSPKFSDSGTSSNQLNLSSSHVSSPQCSYSSNIQPIRPEPISMQPCTSGSKSPVIYSNQHCGNLDTSSSLSCTKPVLVSSASVSTTCPPKSCEDTDKTRYNVANSSAVQPSNVFDWSEARSPIQSSHVQSDALQQQLTGPRAAKYSEASSRQHSSVCASTLDSLPESVVKAASKGSHINKAQSNDRKSKSKLATNESTVSVKTGIEHVVTKPKSKKRFRRSQSPVKPNLDRADQCGQCEKADQKKIKKRCKHQLWHPGHEQLESEKCSPVVEPNSPQNKVPKMDRAEKQIKAKANTFAETKTTRKSNGGARRRRFKSGLDMIRNSRKRPSKAKIPICNKKENAKKEKRNDISMKDLRLESKRLIVNKSLGETLLHRSARNNRLDVVRYCLQSDACEVNARDNAGYTPLHECSSRGNLEVARLLLEHSADVNTPALGGIRPLHDAIENNHIELVRLLLSYGADPHISTYSGSTPLQLCRSKAMLNFLKGFYSDITTERPDIDSLIWKFAKQPSENGFHVFSDVPSDEEEVSENMFYFSEQPLVPLYRLMHNPSSCFYLFCDVLESTGLSEEDFILKHPNVEICKMSKADLAKASPSHWQSRANRWDRLEHEETSIVYQNEHINDILQISSAVIS